MACLEKEHALSGETFLSLLDCYPQSEKYWIAYSGGIDSSVLLYLFFLVKTQLSQAIEAVYIDHGLHVLSHQWGQHCQQQCDIYQFPFSLIKLDADCPQGASIEAWARKNRYALIGNKMRKADILFTGHHQDDQAETFFLQALRGAGPRGLVSMPDIKPLMHGYHARPLLNYSRPYLRQFAVDNQLAWLDDDSNDNVRFDRNYLRSKILPSIKKRWPSYKKTISRAIQHQKEYKKLLDEVAKEDLDAIKTSNESILNIDKLNTLSQVRKKNVIYFWLSYLGMDLPNAKHMDRVLSELIGIQKKKSLFLSWRHTQLRRYRNRLYACRSKQCKYAAVSQWNPAQPIRIMDETMRACKTTGMGIAVNKMSASHFEIRYRTGGEKIHPHGLIYAKTVKKLFQEASVLPWCRDQIPLIYINDRLAAIPGFCVDKTFSAKKNEPALTIIWSGYEKVIFF